MSAVPDAILFEAVSTPPRSLSLRGMRWVCGLAVAAALPPALLFSLLGAWPVLGFFGLELGVLIAMMGLHQRWSARAMETVQLTAGRLRVVTANGRGGLREAELEPYWTEVTLEEEAGGVARLALVQRGRRVELGCFLSAEEKRDLAAALATALRRYRNPVFDNPQLR